MPAGPDRALLGGGELLGPLPAQAPSVALEREEKLQAPDLLADPARGEKLRAQAPSGDPARGEKLRAQAPSGGPTRGEKLQAPGLSEVSTAQPSKS